MTEQAEQIESSLLWQKLAPEETSRAVFGGYSHLVNNRLATLVLVQVYDLDDRQKRKHGSLVASFHTNDLNLQKASLNLGQKTAEEAVRLTAQWLKEKIEEKVRKNLGLPPDEENPAQFWFSQAENFYSLEKFSEDKEIMKKALEDIKRGWENLEALADPERQIKSNAKSPQEDRTIFDFRKELTLPR